MVTWLYLQVFFIVVVYDSQEDGHEDVSVDKDVHNEEDCEEEVGVVCWHPDNNKQKKRSQAKIQRQIDTNRKILDTRRKKKRLVFTSFFFFVKLREFPLKPRGQRHKKTQEFVWF